MLMIVSVTAMAAAASGAQARPKKLIQYGWDIKEPAYVAEHIREMEQKPFDGLMTRTNADGFSHIFFNKTLDEPQTAAYLEAMKSIPWEKFTDNFFMMYSRSNMDWFSEEDWAPDGWVLRNVRLCAWAAKVGRCVGVCFDPEWFWGRSPWTYQEQPRAKEKSFAEFEQIVRKRGAQFMEALQEEYPDLVVHTFFLVSDPRMFKEARKEADPIRRSERTQPESYALWPAFIHGMLDAVEGQTVITDGDEWAYYINTAQAFNECVQMMHEGVRLMFDPQVWPRYQQHVQAAHAIYVDYLCNLLPHRLTVCSNLTPEERGRYAEHNTYYALQTSDQYVWMYSEYMDWWTGQRVPPYLEEAIRSARRKIAHGEPLGFEVVEAISRSNQQVWAQRAAAIEPQTAQIRRLVEAPPVIDGKLEDTAWPNATALSPFVAYVEAPEYDLSATTEAQVAYDDNHLYVAFRCAEPDMQTTREGLRENFDDVSVILAPEQDRPAWRVFGVGADGKRKDAHPGGEEAGWKPDYQSAVRLGEDGWSVEMAIPWKALGRSVPKPGEKLAANVAHMRYRWGYEQYSTWSKFRGKADSRPSYLRVEPELLGMWVFE
jgi:hypothetical protein